MKLGAMRRTFLKPAGQQPVGWADVWDGFVTVAREPIDEPEIAYDILSAEVLPALAPYWRESVLLSRQIGLRSAKAYNGIVEAALRVNATWTPVGVGSKIVTIQRDGPSNSTPEVDEFIREVEQHPAIAVLSGAAAAFRSAEAVYQPPRERD